MSTAGHGSYKDSSTLYHGPLTVEGPFCKAVLSFNKHYMHKEARNNKMGGLPARAGWHWLPDAHVASIEGLTRGSKPYA
jgi:hypothetical protein